MLIVLMNYIRWLLEAQTADSFRDFPAERFVRFC